MISTEICILGGAGFGGGELMRVLANHPHAGPIRAVSRAYAGRPFHAAHPHLRGVVEGEFEAQIDWGGWQAASPTVFSAMPTLEFARRYPELEACWSAAGLAERLRVIDLSADFRLPAADTFERHYGLVHPCPEALGRFSYGLTEWRPQRLRGASRIANPGCFATAIALALLPLAGLELGRVCVAACTGSSGSGSEPGPTVHHATRANDFRAYKVLRHQHLGELEALLAATGTRADIAFVPHSAPLVRGIFATVQIDLHALRMSEPEFRDKYRSCYEAATFVRLVEETPRVGAVAGTNFCDLAVHAADGHAVVLAALDNLGKGMAGQAVQNMNVAYGWDERAGLRLAGAFPG